LTDISRFIGIEVIPETVGQFTGLLDKNGKEIYEGDVIKFVYSPRYLNEKNIGVVLWFDNNHWAINAGNKREYHIDNAVESKVISNIHDNPDLLTIK
jgi:uncharacterized phage protein (TIGR01671 family)